MSSSAVDRAFIQACNWAVVVVVGLTLGMALTTRSFSPASPNAAVLYVCLLLYGTAAVVATTWFSDRARAGATLSTSHSNSDSTERW